ncbi:ComEC family competence protein [Flavobacteriales bacterium]|nr:ComEC family competence protein [Flavobacteriales bacterium]
MNYPIIKCLFFFFLGLIVEINFNFFPIIKPWLLITIISLLIVLEYRVSNSMFFKKISSEVLLMLALILMGGALVQSKNQFNHKNHFINSSKYFKTNHDFLIKLNDPIKIKKEKVTVTGEIVGYIKNRLQYPLTGKVLVHLALDSNSNKLLPGDFIEVNSILNSIHSLGNPNEFDYSKYLKNKQIVAQFFLTSNTRWNKYKSSFPLNRYSTIIRNRCLDIFKRSGLQSNNLFIASALTFGYKNDLNTFVKNIFSRTGAMHVLAVSGLHVGIIFLIVNSIISLLKIPFRYDWLGHFFILLIIWSYALITGLSPSILRATTMMSFFIIARVFNKHTSIYNVLFSSVFFLLFVNPFLIIDVGFQLSILAVFGILFFYPKIYNLINVKHYILKKIWAISSVSLAAQLTTFPISIFYFHQFPNLFLLSNIFVIPLVFILLIVGLFTIVLSFNNSILILWGKLFSFLLSVLMSFLTTIESISFSTTKGLFISAEETLLAYLAILFMVLYHKKRYFFLKITCFSIVFLLICLDLKEDYTIQNQKKVVIYNIPNHFALDLMAGNNHYFIADDDFLKNENLFHQYVTNNWNFNDLAPPKLLSLNKLNSKTIKWENITIAFVDKNWNFNNHIDLAIINEIPNNINQLFSDSNTLKVVKNSKCLKNRKKIEHQLIYENTSVIDLDITGAYTYFL